ncbi:uncharacterized protein BHQ10_006702 [Talaromyces amestolkiae]|uniref:Cytochrome P450 n=1 Tax=Talaromyces amestolkiae TaxID=1196081 RepID=A0A364L4F5_TALAM|nr:uncharacterized protein BHQ10_006702 [Talaromyces amestolkiae]RAO70690.1 hypothetical protein BHQ10_006702 [Talaromyces amestolkiae]
MENSPFGSLCPTLAIASSWSANDSVFGKAFLRFQKWGQEYGPIISLKTGPANLVVLNSAKDVNELFDKRGSIYSSRPPNHIGNEIITRDNVHLLLMPYGQAWRTQRKIYQALVSITAVRSLQPIQDAESTLTIHQLAQNPARYYDHIRRYSTGVILSSVFGVRGPEFDHPNVTRLYHVQDQFTAILDTGATPPVDIFPLLRRLPDFMSPWRRWARRIRKEQRQLYLELLHDVKDRRVRGCRRNCFMDQLLDESFREKYELDDEHIAYIGGVLMEGGSDTTASTLLSFLLAMVKYPVVFRKAQEQVDRILRWRPVAAGGIPHVLIQDDEYEGYHFPKGTTFLANTWAIHNDPELYDKPEDFIPERYEESPMGFKPTQRRTDGLRKTYAFGAGRRICPGQHLAENSLDINVAKLVWAFDIRAGTDPVTGRPISSNEINVDIETQWTDGFLIAPKPFPITLRVRSNKHREVLQQEMDQAQKIFSRYGD